MARKPSGKPWLHGASSWWCATISGERKKLDKDYHVACRKLKALQTASKRGGLGGRDWLAAPFSVLADEYLAHVQAGKKPATYRSLRYRLLRAIRILGVSLRAGELRKFHLTKIDQELQGSGYSPTTVRDTIATVQGVFNWAVEHELLDSTSLSKYRKPREPRPRIIPLPRTVLMMCRWLARKPHQPDDHVFLNRRRRPYTKDCLTTKMDRIRQRAKIGVKGGERIVLYSARHTYGTDGVGKVSDIELAELMGHTEARMTHRYVHLKVEHLQDIQRRIQAAR